MKHVEMPDLAKEPTESSAGEQPGTAVPVEKRLGLDGVPALAGSVALSYKRLQGLFEEVTALANELRKGWRISKAEDMALGGGQRVLEALDRNGPQTVPAIGRVRGNSRQNIQVLVNRLVLEGCVVITGNPAHQRSGLVHLTERGREVLAAAAERDKRALEGLARQVPEEALLAVAHLLRQVRRLLVGEEEVSGAGVASQSTNKRRRGRQLGKGGETSEAVASTPLVSSAGGGTAAGAMEQGVSVSVSWKEPEPVMAEADNGEADDGGLPVSLL
jgi:DNA-binding MarR family transcriptional regulator